MKSPQTIDNQRIDLYQFEKCSSDAANDVARQFGIVFKLPEAERLIHETFGIDLEKANSDAAFELPVPATYVVNQHRRTAYAFVNADYRRRAEPSDILDDIS